MSKCLSSTSGFHFWSITQVAKAASSEAALSDLEDAEEGQKGRNPKREMVLAGDLSCACCFSVAAPAKDTAR